MSVLEEEQFTASVERTEKKWECHICKKIFDSWYICSYHNLLEHSNQSRPPVGIA